MPKQQDWIGVITIDGQKFRDWTSIEAYDAPSEDTTRHFRFTCTEGTPVAKNWANMRIRPGQQCTITLAGEQFLTGFVNYREAVIDAHRHGVCIEGRGRCQDPIDSMVIYDKYTGQFKNKKFQDIAEKLLEDYPVKLKIENPGENMDKVFENFQLQPGETVFNSIERMARHRGIVLAEDAQGDLVAYGAPKEGGGETLEEGKNIKRAACRIIDWENYKVMFDYGQTQGGTNNKGKWGRDISQVLSFQTDDGVDRFRVKADLPEHPEFDLKARTENEKWNDNRFRVDAEIVVTGWTKSGGGLWTAQEQAMVKAPSLILKQQLAIKKVTFTQDNARGTETTLNLSNWKSSKMDYSAGGGGG